MPETPERFACPIGVFLWQQHRLRHPEAPACPPEGSEDWPLAGEYWLHAHACFDCNET